MEHLFSFIVVNIYTYVLTDSFELHTTYLWAGIFTQVESEIQRGQIIHPRSHSLAVSNRHSLNQWMNVPGMHLALFASRLSLISHSSIHNIGIKWI